MPVGSMRMMAAWSAGMSKGARDSSAAAMDFQCLSSRSSMVVTGDLD